MVQKVNGAAYPGVWVERNVTFAKLVFNKNISALAAADLTVLGTSTAAGVGTVADSSFGAVESALVQAMKVLQTKATVLAISNFTTLSYTSAAGATSSGTTVTVGSTTGLLPGMTVTVTAGTGTFAAGTTVVAILSATTFTVSATPSVALSGGASVVTGAGSAVDTMLGHSEGWFSDASGVIATGLPVTDAQAVVTTPGAAPTNVNGALVSVTSTAVTFAMLFTYLNGQLPTATLANGGLTLGPGATSGATPTNSPTGTAGYYPTSL